MRVWFAVVAVMAGIGALGPWFTAAGQAADFQVGAIGINAPWARASLRQRGAVSIFMSVTNTGEEDRLMAANSPMSEEIEFRQMVVFSDVIRSARMTGFDIPPGTHIFLPDGPQLLMLRADTVTEGSVIPLVLSFERAGTIEIEVPVLNARAMGPP